MTFEHLVYKAVFGCLLWFSTLFFHVGRPRLKSLQLFGIDHGQVTTMGWKTELMYMTVAQIIAEKSIADRSPWECLHTAYWNFYAIVMTFISGIFASCGFLNSAFAKYIRDPWYRFQGIQLPDPPPKAWYSYTKLAERHIRLILIHRDWKLRVSYHLIDVDLDTAPPYETISYTWGDSKEFEEIIINQKAFQTPRTVADILRRRSKIVGLQPGRTRALWIDYLCINQEDIPEKNKQVPLMKEIYQKSKHVMVYLGDGLNASKANWLLIKLHSLSFMHTFEEMSKRYMLEKDSPSWHALARMISHPYFTRIWIVQEIAASPKIWVTYGGGLIDWELMCWAFQLFARPEMTMLLPKSDGVMRKNMALALEHGNIIPYIRNIVQNKGHLSLIEALALCARFEATDPRDKIFALLGLITDNLDIQAWIDYNRSVEDVYRDTTRYLLAQEPNPLHILNLTGLGYTRKLESLPSWVPDLTTPPKAANFDTSPTYIHKYNASGGRQHNSGILLNAGLNIIRLQGIRVDEIEHLVDPCSIWVNDATEEEIANAPREIKVWLQKIETLTENHSPNPYFTKQPREEAFWRTLLGDRTVEGRPAPADMEECYHAFRTVFLNPASVSSATYGTLAQLNIKSSKFLGTAAATIRARKFCITKKGYIGWVPPLSQEGDIVCIFAGLYTPYLVRPYDRGTGMKMGYRLVGACYINGMMDGEMWNHERESETFSIC